MTTLSQGDEGKECAVAARAGGSSLRALPLFSQDGSSSQTLEADFFHCQQMPARICISTLPLKRQPDFCTATLYWYLGIGKLSAAPINGSSIFTHQKH